MPSVPAAAYVDSGGTVVLAANTLPQVIANPRTGSWGSSPRGWAIHAGAVKF